MPGGAHEDAKAWSWEEDQLIKDMVPSEGTQWKVIAKSFPGRTPASVRNRWLRLERGRKLRQYDPEGELKNWCKRCGQPRKGHICTAEYRGGPQPRDMAKYEAQPLSASRDLRGAGSHADRWPDTPGERPYGLLPGQLSRQSTHRGQAGGGPGLLDLLVQATSTLDERPEEDGDAGEEDVGEGMPAQTPEPTKAEPDAMAAAAAISSAAMVTPVGNGGNGGTSPVPLAAAADPDEAPQVTPVHSLAASAGPAEERPSSTSKGEEEPVPPPPVGHDTSSDSFAAP